MKHLSIFLLLICLPFINSLGNLKTDSISNNIEISKIDSIDSNQIVNANIDTIRIEKRFTEVYGYKNNKLMTINDYKTLFETYPTAFKHFKTANSLHKTGNFFGFIGGFMFGYIGVLGLKELDSVDETWGAALGVSAAVMGVGLIIYSQGNKAQIKAINSYNNSPKVYQEKNDVSQLKIGFTNSGIGLIYNF